MKRVHTTQQLAHLFCNMTDNDLEGFKTPSRNMYVENGVLWSYGTHYPMAKKYQYGEGLNYRELILVNSNKSSVTTEKHKSFIYRSTKINQVVFSVPNILDPQDSANVEHLMNNLCNAISGILSGLKYSKINDFNSELFELNQYCKYFGIKNPVSIPQDFIDDLTEISASNFAKFKEREKVKKAKQDAKNKEIIDRTHSNLHLWLSNSEHDLKPTSYELQVYCDYLGYDLVRLKDSNTLTTQRGAEVSLDHARRILELYRRNRMSILGKHVGAFRIEYVGKLKESQDGFFQDLESDKNTVLTIGCHKINVDQAVKVMGV